jgi:hypothetical protein
MSRHLQCFVTRSALCALLTAWLAIGVASAQSGGERHERGSPAERGFGGMPGGFRGGPGGAGHFGDPVAAERGFRGGPGFAGRAAPFAIHNGRDRTDPGWHGGSGWHSVAGAGWDSRGGVSGWHGGPDWHGAVSAGWGWHGGVWGWHGGWDPGWGWGWRIGWGWGGPWFWNGIVVGGGPFAIALTPPVFIAPLPIFVAPPPIVAAIPFTPPVPPPVAVATTPVPAPTPPPLVVAPQQLIAAAAPPPILVLPPPPVLVAAVPPLFVVAPVGFGFFIEPPTLAFNFGVPGRHGWGGLAFAGRPADPHAWHSGGWPAAHVAWGGARFGSAAGWHGGAWGGRRWSGGGYHPAPGRTFLAHAEGFGRGREERR